MSPSANQAATARADSKAPLFGRLTERLNYYRTCAQLFSLASADTQIMPNPVIQNLEGDNIRMSAGQIVHLDVGGDAILSQGSLAYLDIFFNSDQSSADHLGIDTQSSAIVLTNGTPGSLVSVRLPDAFSGPNRQHRGLVRPMDVGLRVRTERRTALIGNCCMRSSIRTPMAMRTRLSFDKYCYSAAMMLVKSFLASTSRSLQPTC